MSQEPLVCPACRHDKFSGVSDLNNNARVMCRACDRVWSADDLVRRNFNRTRVKSSVPPSKVDVIPDESTVYDCWMLQLGGRQTESVTVYRDRKAGKYWVVHHDDECEERLCGEFPTYSPAVECVEEVIDEIK